MSAETWIAEFYPVPADKVPVEEALDHSIRKWEGALAKNLEKHGLDKPPIGFYDDSCALCVHYLWVNSCAGCPLFIVRGDIRCHEERPRERMSPFVLYDNEGNPRPMLAWLKKAKEMK